MEQNSNKYLTLGISLGLVFGAGAGIIVCLLWQQGNFIFGVPIGAGLGMLIGIIVGTNLDSNHKKTR